MSCTLNNDSKTPNSYSNQSRITYKYENEDDLIINLSKFLEDHAKEAISERNIFLIGLSGGSLVNQLAKGLPKINTDWSKWRFFFCDERIVPFDNKESTYGAYLNKLPDVIPLQQKQFVSINPELSAGDAAKDYIEKIKEYFPNHDIPKFDVLLLGMGPDGHTCSLFPGHPLLNEMKVWVAPITDSPKPPPQRITLTYPVLNNARRVVFVVAGESKAKAVQEIFKCEKPLPAGLVKPAVTNVNGKVIWLLDQKAANLTTL